MRVTVVLPVFNRAAALARALGSIAAQTSAPDEVIVIDDGSSDGSAEVACGFADRLAGLRVLTQANAGAGAARNAGIRATRGDWIAFLDSDDEWRPGKIAALRACAGVDDAVEFIHTDWSYSFPDGHVRPSGNFPAGGMIRAEFLLGGFAIKTSTVAVTRQLLDRTQMLFAEDLRTCEDYCLFWPAVIAARRIAYIATADTLIHETAGSLTRDGRERDISRDNIRATTRVIGWARATGAPPWAAARLEAVRYRCQQTLLLRSGQPGGREFRASARFMAREAGWRSTARAAASILLDARPRAGRRAKLQTGG